MAPFHKLRLAEAPPHPDPLPARKSGLPDLRTYYWRSRVNPTSRGERERAAPAASSKK
jgi:hypothetical protein